MQRDYIETLGAIAAREGLTLWDCPYYRADAMPGHTGESIMEWRSKVEAWESGWLVETESWKPTGGMVRYVPRNTERHRN